MLEGLQEVRIDFRQLTQGTKNTAGGIRMTNSRRALYIRG
jgi:hypothetical protein